MEKYMEIFGKFTKEPNPMVMVVSFDGTFYFVNRRSRKVRWYHHSYKPILSGVAGRILSPEITGNEDDEIRQQCIEIFKEDPMICKLGEVRFHLDSNTGKEVFNPDEDNLLHISRTDWEIVFKSSVLCYSHIDVFLPCVDRTLDLSERLKCLVLHARSADKLVDICDRLRIQLPGNGSLSRVVNQLRKIKIHGDHQAEKIEKTSFFSGEFQGHQVIVKKVLKEKNNDYSKTLELYRECHNLDGVVKLEMDESDEDYHYLAFEVCAGNLEQVFSSGVIGSINESRKIDMMRQLIFAVSELHFEKNVMHRNLNPLNVLIQKSYHRIKVKLCGLSNCRTIGVKGEVKGEVKDYADPINYRDTFMYKSELRDLAETLLYIMTAGEYAFKDKGPGYYEKLATEGYSLPEGQKKIAYKGFLRAEFGYLIEVLLDPIQNSISLENVLKFPCFWSPEDKMTLIRDVADQLLDKDKALLESSACKVFSKNWGETIEKDWFESMKTIKKKGSLSSDDVEIRHYDGKTMRDLIILTRNSVNHPGEVAPGTDMISLEAYLTQTWPLFFFHVYRYARRVCPRNSAMHQKYFM